LTDGNYFVSGNLKVADVFGKKRMCVTKWTENVIAGEVFWIGKRKGTN
jgi:hypothetical protein